MRAALLLLAVASCGGCVGVDAWPRNARARPELVGISPEELPAWRVTVAQAVGLWTWRMNGNDLRHVECAFPIEVAPVDDADACPVRLVSPELWIHGDRGGVQDDCYIDIKGPVPSLSLVTHEFGHAIGLDHSDDPASIMHAHVHGNLDPSDEDVRAARSAIGCD